MGNITIAVIQSHVAPSVVEKAAIDWANATVPKKTPKDQPYSREENAFEEALGIAADWYYTGHVNFCTNVRFNIISTFEK